jgi:hypothetical protein
LRLPHPEDRKPPEEEVAKRPSADPGHDGDDEDSEEVEPLAPPGERATCREDEDAGVVERAEDGVGDDEDLSISSTR